MKRVLITSVCIVLLTTCVFSSHFSLFLANAIIEDFKPPEPSTNVPNDVGDLNVIEGYLNSDSDLLNSGDSDLLNSGDSSTSAATDDYKDVVPYFPPSDMLRKNSMAPLITPRWGLGSDNLFSDMLRKTHMQIPTSDNLFQHIQGIFAGATQAIKDHYHGQNMDSSCGECGGTYSSGYVAGYTTEWEKLSKK
jgi:hypothetical protein